MKTSAWAATRLLAAAFSFFALCLAADGAMAGQPGSVLDALAGTAVSTAELGHQQARGVLSVKALADGTVAGNSVRGVSVTGTIANTNSINNNVGITSVFQNTGNNSLFQSSTSIFISVH